MVERTFLALLIITPAVISNIDVTRKKYDIRKCCGITEVLIEDHMGTRICQSVDKVGVVGLNPKVWRGLELKNFAINHGTPECDTREHLIPLYHHVRDQNVLDLAENGTLTFSNKIRKVPVHLSYVKYCIDTIIISHNYSHIDEGDDAEFAYVCLDVSRSISDIVNLWVFPIGIGISMGCLTLTFLLYFILPQLRDLTGRFILAICACLTASYSIRLVEAFGMMHHSNIDQLSMDFVYHVCVLGSWLSLNCMGHHVWKVIMAESIFTRVTDGKRCCYYTAYVALSTAVIVATAVTVHHTVGDIGAASIATSSLGLVTLGVFYIPVFLLFLANVFFFWSCNLQIGKQLVYNRSMQHFQVNFDLYSKLLMVLASCGLFQTLGILDIAALHYIGMVFSILQGPLIFLVCMCRTRIAYLFKRYFCKDNACLCCGGNGDFIELPSTELSTIDKLREKEEVSGDKEANKSLLDRWGDANVSSSAKDREMSRSLFNVREKKPEGHETPLMKMGRLLKTNSVNLATMNFGWRRETAV